MTDPKSLTPMEELFYWDDRPAYPCACFFRAEFRGPLDRATLEAAITSALRKVPRLYSKAQPNKAGRLEWRVPDEPRFAICWDAAALAGECRLPEARRIDLEVETGVRFYAAIRGDRSVVIIQFHHASSDALGITRLLRDLLHACREPARVEATGAPSPSVSAWPPRNRWWPPWQMPLAVWRAGQIAQRRPLSLVLQPLPDPESPLHDEYPAAVWRTLDEVETTRLARGAAQQKVTVNDLLLRDLLLALSEWRGPGGIAGRCGWVRILVPELSDQARLAPESTRDPVSLLFLDIHTNEISSPRLLAKIHEEMLEKKRAGDGDLFRHGVAFERWRIGSVARHVRANKCLFTTVFSNLGRVSMDSFGTNREEAQSLRLESVHGVHVVRRYAPMNFMVMTVDGRLSVTMSFDSRVVQRTDAEALFDGLIRKVRASIEGTV